MVSLRDKAVVLVSRLPGEGLAFTSRNRTIIPILCVDEHDYWRGWSAYWDSNLTFVGIEHDMEVHDRHVSELLACPQILCSWMYYSHWKTTGLPRDVISAGTGERKPGTRFLNGDEEWAGWSAIGLIKITPEARIGPLAQRHWSTFELSIEESVQRPWHMHGQHGDLVRHHHW